MTSGVLAVLLACAAAAFAAPQDREVVEEAIVQVNGDIITLSEFNRQLDPIVEEMRRQLPAEELEQQIETLRKERFNALINQLLVRQRARDMGYSLPDDVYKQMLDNIKNQIQARSDEELRLAMQQRGITQQDLREIFEFQYFIQLLFAREVGRDLYSSESRVQEFYDENADRYTEPASLRLSQISMPYTAQNRDEQMAAASAVLDRLRNGEDFGEAYRSVTPGAADNADGDIGIVDLNSIRREMADEVRDLGGGDITGVITTPAALLILKITEKTEERLMPLEEIKDRVQLDMQQDMTYKEMSKYLLRLKKQSYVRILSDRFEGYYDEEYVGRFF